MAAKAEQPGTNPNVARWNALHQQVDASVKASHGGQLPFIPEGQAIGYAETRKEAIAADLGAATVRAAAADPETFTQDPEPEPVIIEGAFKPEPHQVMVEITRNHRL
jgi:hypothetical protein